MRKRCLRQRGPVGIRVAATKRATTAGAIASMSLGIATALLFMFKDGLDANTPIYYSLAVGLLSFVLVSLFSRRPASVASAA